MTIDLKSSTYEYIYPYFDSPSFSNYGTLGLIQNPTARFHEQGTLGLTWSHNDPYLRGSIMAYPFNWFEASFQYTDINNQLYSPFKNFSGNQSLKDKSFDAKFRLLREGRLTPQLAIGFRDIGGTGLFGSEFIVGSKRIFSNLDLTIGLGWGTLIINNISNPLSKISSRFDSRNSNVGLGGKVNVKDFFSGDSGYFGGIEYILPFKNGIRLKLEIDGTNYQTESKIPLNQNSKINYGVIIPFSKRFQTKISYTRGNTINFGFSYALELGSRNPLNLKKAKKVEFENSDIIRRIT